MSKFSSRRILYAILSGLLITASFPPLKYGWLAWISLIPLLKAIEGESPFNAFRLGIITGLVHYISLLYWIINVLSTYGGLDIFSSFLILILFCFYLSLYTGVFSLLVNKLKGTRLKIFFFAAIWISLEYIRAKILTGFPWCLMGYSQFRHISLIQIVDITGVYGISFLIIGVNISLYLLLFTGREERKKLFVLAETLILCLLITLTLGYGKYRLTEYERGLNKQKKIGVLIIQGNIDQSVKWNPEYQMNTIQKYIRLTQKNITPQTDIVVWPETAVPFFFQDNNRLSKELYSLASEDKVHFIFGSPAYKVEDGKILYFNSAYYISPKGLLKGQYNKTHLVPFGEYVPLKKFLPFIHKLVQAAGNFTPGNSVEPINLGDMKAGILICYEIIFPEISRELVNKGASVLINLTNDAWFGLTGAPYQHLDMSVFRAVENRRFLVRSANTGFSTIVDATGKIKIRSNLFVAQAISGNVLIGENRLSFYTKFGDIFTQILFIMCLIKISFELFYSFSKKKRSIN